LGSGALISSVLLNEKVEFVSSFEKLDNFVMLLNIIASKSFYLISYQIKNYIGVCYHAFFFEEALGFLSLERERDLERALMYL
jgi:hypothetical protein